MIKQLYEVTSNSDKTKNNKNRRKILSYKVNSLGFCLILFLLAIAVKFIAKPAFKELLLPLHCKATRFLKSDILRHYYSLLTSFVVRNQQRRVNQRVYVSPTSAFCRSSVCATICCHVHGFQSIKNSHCSIYLLLVHTGKITGKVHKPLKYV